MRGFCHRKKGHKFLRWSLCLANQGEPKNGNGLVVCGEQKIR
jgi:hypothetical protein